MTGKNTVGSNNSSSKISSRRKKIRPSRGVYVLACFLLGAILFVTIIPTFLPRAVTIFEPSYLTVIFALLSLAISLVTFGVLGDSEAFIKTDSSNGLLIQLCGSAAGFVIFFYLLTKGLFPYSNLTVYLYDLNERPLNRKDGELEVILAGNVRRSIESDKGFVEFTYLPKSESHKLLVTGNGWIVKSIKPENCITEGRVMPGHCKVIDVALDQTEQCIIDKSIKLISFDKEEITTDLDIIFRRFAEQVQKVATRAEVKLQFSDQLLDAGLHKIMFKMERKSEVERTVCTHLADIEGWYNRFSGTRKIRVLASCNTIFVTLAHEPIPEGGVLCTEK